MGTAQNNICLWKAGQDIGGNACGSIRRNDTVRACRLHTSILTIYILIYPYIHISKESTDISRKQLWWKLIVRFEIMKFSDRSCLWLYLIVSSAEFTTTGMGAQNGTGRTFTKARTLYKEVFHKTWYMRRKDMKEVRSSAVSVYPLYQLEEKHHQIRAYILLIKVIAVRHHQIRVPSCQVDSITAVRHY